jgi:hypothetical protein
MYRLALFAVVILSCAAKDNVTNVPVSPEFQPFEKAVRDYMKLRQDLEKKLPKLPERAQPEQIVAHKTKLREAIQAARSNARQGDVFVPSTRSQFVRTVASEMKGSAGRSARNTVTADNPKAPGVPGDVKVAVNATYPDTAPVSTLPPTLLLRLPTLPEGLEYRFVGRSLILRDVEAALIVDYLANVLPQGVGI